MKDSDAEARGCKVMQLRECIHTQECTKYTKVERIETGVFFSTLFPIISGDRSIPLPAVTLAVEWAMSQNNPLIHHLVHH